MLSLKYRALTSWLILTSSLLGVKRKFPGKLCILALLSLVEGPYAVLAR